MAIKGQWTKIAADEALQRSSQCISVVENKAYVFGGELKPRQPRDNAIHVIDLDHSAQEVVSSLSADKTGTAPSPRVGSATATIGENIYLFSGRGGEAMAPIDESGAVWSFNTSSQSWSQITPTSQDSIPEPRSYHCSTSDGKSLIYVHAGCPEKGRLDDLWSFDVSTQVWKKLTSAPSPPRGGPSIVYAKEKVYRMNGFDGQREVGGTIDIYDIMSDSWSSKTFTADGKSGPGARSVAALVYAEVGGKGYLINLFGESDPSDLGHLGAGKMLSDVWAYSIDDEVWSLISAGGEREPQPRGWFDADAVSVDGQAGVVVTGGLGESNDRIDDIWLLKLAV